MTMNFATMIVMRHFAWAVAAMFVFSPGAVAAGWDETLQNVEMFQQSMTEDAALNAALEDDAMIWSSEELLPASEDLPDEQIPDAVAYLSIKVDGVPVLLTDVPTGEWYLPFIRDVASRGWISGYRGQDGRPTGFFGPADSVTIEQLAKLAVEAASVDPFSCGESLKNTSVKNTWSERYVRCAEYKGWAVFSDGTVDLTRPATRAEVVVTVLQAFGARIAARSGTLFVDVTTSTVFGAAIETAANASIVSGYTGKDGVPTGIFGPEDSVNRAETAKIFSLAFQVYRKGE